MAKKEKKKIHEIEHPSYKSFITFWEKYRLTFEGGKDFVEKYLEKFSLHEDTTDFKSRRDMSYCPAHSKAAIIEIKNAIYQRMVDITREGGPESYKEAILGKNNGVDLNGNTMNGFIGREVLPWLLVMKKVGVYIDKQKIENNLTRLTAKTLRPYLYTYAAEDIRSWSYDNENNLTVVLLREHTDEIDSETGLVVDTVERYRLLQKIKGGVKVDFYDVDGELIPGESTVLTLPEIPFVIFEITDSLMKDIADYQIALLNLASSDLNYALKSNCPFYTEQYNPLTEMSHLLKSDPSADGEGEDAGVAAQHNTKTGVSQGRRYPKGTERPAFIHPSAEPLEASMHKQRELRQEIRQLVMLALTNLEPRRASAESKEYSDRGLEAGLSYIGLELAFGERQIASIWATYEGSEEPATISYPETYSLKSEEERQAEADRLANLIPKIPSIAYQRVLARRIVVITVGTKITNDKLKEINTEIDAAKIIAIDPDVIRSDHEAGLVSSKTASEARLYPVGDVEQAQRDRVERVAMTIVAQSKASARGDADSDPDGKVGAKLEKKESQDPYNDLDSKKGTRGEAK